MYKTFAISLAFAALMFGCLGQADQSTAGNQLAPAAIDNSQNAGTLPADQAAVTQSAVDNSQNQVNSTQLPDLQPSNESNESDVGADAQPADLPVQ